MKRKIKKYFYIFILSLIKIIIYNFIKIDKKLVLLSSLNGNFSDNSKYLFLELLASNDFKPYWVAHDALTYENMHSQNYPVLKLGFSMLTKALKARFYITTHNYQDVFFIKGKKTIVINLWHGTPLKKMGYDSLVDIKRLNFKKSIGFNEYKYINYLCVSSNNIIPAFESSFNIKKSNIIPTGLPRNDILFKAKRNTSFNQSIKDKIRDLYDIRSKNIALYAPTFRDNFRSRRDLINNLINIFKDLDVGLIVKLHPLDKDFKDFKHTNIDIQELLIASDLLISDYSSVFFDYAILERPIILFLYDIDDYKLQRGGFYFDIENFPFNLCYNTDELKILVNKALSQKTADLGEFSNKFNRRGCASCRIIKFMKKIQEK